MKIVKPDTYIINLDSADNKALADCWELLRSIYEEMIYLKADSLVVYWPDNEADAIFLPSDIEHIIDLLEVGISSKHMEIVKEVKEDE